MDCRAFPGPSSIKIEDLGKDIPLEASPNQEENKPSADKGKAIAASWVRFKTYQRRVSEYQKLQCANNYFKAAYQEVMRVAEEAGTWVRMKPALGSLDDIVSEFQTPALPGKKLESSVATAVIPNVRASEMVTMLMNVNKNWSKSLFPIVNYGEEYTPRRILQHLRNTDTAIDGVVQVYAELQLPTTSVPTRYFDFFRYLKEIMKSIYIVVDISSHYLGDGSANCNSRKRPSGVIIRERGPLDCEIIYVENVEVDEPRENMYSSKTSSNFALCANHWISTLLWKLRRDKSTFIDVKIDLHYSAGDYLLALTRSMKHFYMECFSEHPNEDLLSVLTNAEDPIRLLHNKTLEEFIGYVGLNSFHIQAKPLSVFHFLMKKDLQLQFRSTSNSDTEEEPEELFKFITDDKSNTISLHRKRVEEETRYCLQEATRDEYCSFILSKLINDDHVNFNIVSGVQSVYQKGDDRVLDTVTSGFAIMPDGPGGLQCDGSLITFLVQLHYDRTEGPVTLDTVREDFLSDLMEIIRELKEELVGEKEDMFLS
ncbi:homeobox-leucine zipper protein PROTODERMAL FACTOR 2-like [Herrania umbratica]|uniref:Homeobox-leucine zipper protein PROTODERMAL FACTOR 2-like n=1 Tax=Herrania umbratica TaxID=108875 RepID=A0A6J1A284_9ROSI|nr:homeobox-leucine zipper protein PROTODERMAL FACTOR 2-like [Herrania umbratica]